MPNNPSDNEVTLAVLMANAKSGTFRSDLTTYLSSQVPKATEDFKSFTAVDFGFTGIDDYSFVGEDEYFGFLGIGKDKGFLGLGKSTTTSTPKLATPKLTSAQKKAARVDTTTNPQGKTKVGLALSSIGGFLKDNVLTSENVNAGIQIGLQSMSNKTQAKQNALQEQSLQLQGVQDQMKQNLPNQPQSNMMTYVWVGVGILAVSVIVFLAYKKYKK
jgi:hypothetical protein